MMNDQIHEAIKLADGFGWQPSSYLGSEKVYTFLGIIIAEDNEFYLQFYFDALAMQLMRQVNISDDHWVSIHEDEIEIWYKDEWEWEYHGYKYDDNLTMSLIESIVNSKVLKQ